MDPSIKKQYKDRFCAESFLAYLNLFIPLKNNHQNQVPVLVIGGDQDEIFTEEDFIATADRYNADLEIIEGGSHDLMLDHTHPQVQNSIHKWLTQEENGK